ncbi:membrane protein [Mycolicibacterium litorale]|uniref:Membrane protein n=1 Tax=Mycolicibacterium litorale TaxID=758802 RepID=A0A6S6NZT0_9MYCO|nr:patatin-like phospholipase family protein [Mycolicibacterium litorale]BCI51595.1 membrane protein [Mycolicibacterium litorale]
MNRADLVCEGGGVRGIGLVGAVRALADAGYAFPRVAGSSAGAVVAAMIAALQAAGQPLSRLDELAQKIDYAKFADPTLLTRIPVVGPALSLAANNGLYRGDYLESLLTDLLGDLGVRTFGDLRTGEEPQRNAWSLVVTASDLSRRRLVRIPWDLPNYGLDPDEFPVARAVRASSAVPFAFEPVEVSGATWVDGGLLSNFPVQLFDSTDDRPRWPTFGIRLSARAGRAPTHRIRGPLSLAFGALETLISDQDAAYIDDPCTVRRTIFVPTESVGSLDFDITDEERDALYGRGLRAAEEFLASWDYPRYLRDCRGIATEV